MRTIWRAATSSVAMSASLNCSAWKLAIGLPNCLRSCMYCWACVSAPWAAPTEQVAMLMRPPSRPFIAILKPSPSRPSRWSAGMRTLSKLMVRVGWLFQPIFSSFLP